METQDTGTEKSGSEQNKRSTSRTCKSAINKRRYQVQLTRRMPSLRKLPQRRKLHQHRRPIPINLPPIPRMTRLKSRVLSNNTLWSFLGGTWKIWDGRIDPLILILPSLIETRICRQRRRRQLLKKLYNDYVRFNRLQRRGGGIAMPLKKKHGV